MMNMTSSLNRDTGVFIAPGKREYTVILTAMLKDIGHPGLNGYAQLFLLVNGQMTSPEHYLLVRRGHIAELRLVLTLHYGQKLKVLVGHHMDGLRLKTHNLNYRDEYYSGLYLEQVRFCIFPRTYIR